MGSESLVKLKIDIAMAAFISVVVYGVLFIFNQELSILKSISTLTSTFTTILGVLFTVLAIIYTFESTFEENPAVVILKDKGKYRNVTGVFVYSVITIFFIWIYVFSLSIFPLHKSIGYVGQAVVSMTLVYCFILVVMRVFRCFYIFKLLEDAIKHTEK